MATMTAMRVVPVHSTSNAKQAWMDDSTNTKSTDVTYDDAYNSDFDDNDDEPVSQLPKKNTAVIATEPSPLLKAVSEPAIMPRKDDDNEDGSEKSERLSLRFSTLTIREYPRCLGYNVTVAGPPISISWTHQSENVYNVDDYEKTVEGTRRAQPELKIPSKHREDMLKDSGHSRKEILEAIKQSNIARNNRKRTVEMLGMSGMHEAFEKVSNPFKFGKKKEKKRLSKLGFDMKKASKRHSSPL